jgi:hypothetical protein
MFNLSFESFIFLLRSKQRMIAFKAMQSKVPHLAVANQRASSYSNSYFYPAPPILYQAMLAISFLAMNRCWDTVGVVIFARFDRFLVAPSIEIFFGTGPGIDAWFQPHCRRVPIMIP